MLTELNLLITTAASVAFIHTVLGPDHYLPFVMMSKAGKWSILKTVFVTVLCGIGHVGSSILLGLVGIATGLAVHKLVIFESIRGNLAAWLFIAFGLVYLVWGIRKSIKNKPHAHGHFHEDGNLHAHTHTHHREHMHVHEKKTRSVMTTWILFTVFILGPCEPLIPLVMYPASQKNMFGIYVVSLVFGVITILTMLTVVMISIWGINLLPLKKIERYTHPIAGATILLCGLGMVFLGF